MTCANKWDISHFMKHFNDLLKFFGGTRATARALGVPSSTLHNWKNKGFPGKIDVLDSVRNKLSKEGVNVTIEDLFRLKHE